MKLTPKHIIFIAVSKYLSVSDLDILKADIGKYSSLPDMKFIKIVEKYFDFKILRDKPLIQEDVWIFNYLMYENRKKENHNIFDIGEKIEFKGRLLRKGLILKYENNVIIHLENFITSNNLIIKNLY